jgi:hypothetical protein
VRYPLRYKGVGRSEGVEPIDCGVTVHRVAVYTTTAMRRAVLDVAWGRRTRCGGGGTRTPSRVSRGGSLATSCNTVLPRLRRFSDRDGIRTRILPLDKRALSPLSYTANDAGVVAREELNLRPPLYQSGALNQLSYRTTGTPCGTRTRSSALKGRETNPYPNGA